MHGSGGARGRRAGLLIGLLMASTLLLASCAGHGLGFGDGSGGDDVPQAYPNNYRAEMLAAMHAYLNDPTGIRDAAIGQPMLKPVAGRTRYIVCLRFDGKQDNGMYAGDKQIAAEFRDGRFDDFLDAAAAREPCGGVAYAPFPELEQLKP